MNICPTAPARHTTGQETGGTEHTWLAGATLNTVVTF